MQRSKVVLPAPFGPIRATRRPAGTLRFTPWRIGTPFKVRRKSLTSIAGGSLLLGVRRCMADQSAFQNRKILPHAVLIGGAREFAILERVQRRDTNGKILAELLRQFLRMLRVRKNRLHAFGLNGLAQPGQVPRTGGNF